MRGAEGWAFLSLIGGLVGVTLSLTLLEGAGQVAGAVVGTGLCILSGGLYAVAGGKRRQGIDRPAGPLP
jgi:hypothetical protein